MTALNYDWGPLQRAARFLLKALEDVGPDEIVEPDWTSRTGLTAKQVVYAVENGTDLGRELLEGYSAFLGSILAPLQGNSKRLEVWDSQG